MKFKHILPLLLMAAGLVLSSFTDSSNLGQLTGGNSKKWVVKHYLLNEYELDAFKCMIDKTEFEFSVDKTLKKKHMCAPDSQLVTISDRFDITGDQLSIGSENFELVELTNNYLRIKKLTTVKVKGSEVLKIDQTDKQASIEIIFESR